MLRPDNDTVTLGTSYSSFTETATKAFSETSSVTDIKRNVSQLNQKTGQYKIAEQQLTSLLAQSFGVFKTEEVLLDGSTVHYLHDKPTLAGSRNIWKMTGDAFAVSSDGGITWNAGMDTSGNAIMNILSVIGIEASWIKANNLTAISANLGGWEIREGAIFKRYYDEDRNVWWQIWIQPPDALSAFSEEQPFIRVERSGLMQGPYSPWFELSTSQLRFSAPNFEPSADVRLGLDLLQIVRGDGKRVDIDTFTGIAAFTNMSLAATEMADLKAVTGSLVAGNVQLTFVGGILRSAGYV
jgi:hypothetical protein